MLFFQDKNLFFKGLVLVLFLLTILEQEVSGQSYALTQGERREKELIDRLLSKMTLEEKVGQLTILGADHAELESFIEKGVVGGTNGMLPGKKDVSSYLTHLQKKALQSRLGIPLLFMGDVIHGYRTTFPVNIAMASSWDTSLIRKVDSVAAFEATADGMNWSFAPMLDLSRDPRWGRVVEGAGEDPFLAAAIAEAEVRGLQGRRLDDPRTMAATAKHFVAYGAVEAGRDYNTVDISQRSLYENYLPPFRAAIDAGVAAVMPAFVALNGIPVSGNRQLLQQLLRKECGFKGLIVSDYDAIPEMLNHRVSATASGTAELALHAGIDMDLHSTTYLKTLPKLVREGKISRSEIEEAVRKVLVLKYRLGLFDHPFLYGNHSPEYQDTLLERHRPLARKMARESIVLLKNDSLQSASQRVLPLSENIKRLAVIGPLVKDKKEMLGPVHALGRASETVSIWEGLQEAVSQDTKLTYAEGTGIEDTSTAGFAQAVHLAKQADAVVMVLGEDAGMSGEGDSRSMLGLPGNQLELVKAVEKTGKPVIILLVSGRPLTVPWLQGHVSALLEIWEPGTETGHAVADVLFGKYNPSGRLPMTFPRNVGQIPIYYNHLSTGRPFVEGNKYTSRYVDVPNSPLYPFGYGLSYTYFNYTKPQLSTDFLRQNDSLTVSVEVTNGGQKSGTEIVQLYLKDKVASVSPPVKRLKGFKRITLEAGETQTVSFRLFKDASSFFNEDRKPVVEAGEFEVYVGKDAETTNKASFWLIGS